MRERLKKYRNILTALLVAFPFIIFLIPCIIIAGALHSPLDFFRDVSVQSYTAIENISIKVTNGGTFTNGTFTNFYRVNATSLVGRLPTSVIVSVIFKGNTNTSNAVFLSWSKKAGLRRYIIEFATNTANFTNWVDIAITTTNFTDLGTNIPIENLLTSVYSQIPSPTVPWGTTQDVASVQAQVTSNDQDIANLFTSNTAQEASISALSTSNAAQQTSLDNLFTSNTAQQASITDLFTSNITQQAQINSNLNGLATNGLLEITLNGATTSVAITFRGSTNKGLAVFESSIQGTGTTASLRITTNRSIVLSNPDGGEAFGLGVFFEGSEDGMIIGLADAPFTPRIDWIHNTNPVPTAGMIVFHVGGGGSTIGGGFLVQGAGDIKRFQVTTGEIVIVTNAMLRAEAAVTVVGAFTNKGLALLEGGAVIDSLTYPIADGSSGQAIVTDGAGTLSFGTAAEPKILFNVAHTGAAQVVATSTDTKVDWDLIIYTNGAPFDLVNNEFVIPTNGIYKFTGQTIYTATISHLAVSSQIHTNGAVISLEQDATLDSIPSQRTTRSVSLKKGDLVSLVTSQSSGGNRSLFSIKHALYFEGHLLKLLE